MPNTDLDLAALSEREANSALKAEGELTLHNPDRAYALNRAHLTDDRSNFGWRSL